MSWNMSTWSLGLDSWLPYSTYLYFGFHLLCSMKKLKEHSREICPLPPMLCQKKNQGSLSNPNRGLLAFVLSLQAEPVHLWMCMHCELCILNCSLHIAHWKELVHYALAWICILNYTRALCTCESLCIVHFVRAENINTGSLLLSATPTLCLSV